MIKEWATVVSWQNGVARVSCDVKASCNSCASRAGCGSRVLNKLGPQTSHTISVPSEQPLVAGQKVELGIAEGSLLGSAMLVYLSPLVGLFIMGGLSRPYLVPMWPPCVVPRWGASGDSGLLKVSHRSLPRAKSGSLSFSALGWHQTSFVSRRSLLRPDDPSGFINFYVLIQKTPFLHAIPVSKCISR